MKTDWSRYEKAKELRDSGATYKEIAMSLGVSSSRAREIVCRQERRLERIKHFEENPHLVPWYMGLRYDTVYEIKRIGFSCKDELNILCADKFEIYRGYIALDGWKPCDKWEWKNSSNRLSIKALNDIRKWLGCAPYIKPPKHESEQTINSAIKMLERYGYTILPPANCTGD